MNENPVDDKPVPDVADQQRPVSYAESDEDDGFAGTAEPLEADDADVAEQRRVVPIPADEL